MSDDQWFVYLLQCKSGNVYTGVTSVVDARMKARKTGRGRLFTRIDPPVRLRRWTEA